MFNKWCLAPMVLVLFLSAAVAGQAAQASNPIPPGTVITLKNWQHYQQFMPKGMQGLFAGRYFWKLPSDFRMVIGPTSFYPLPKVYQANTRKYSKQVKIISLPDGGHALSGYVAGTPFPHPAAPMKGYKILADLWYRYVPYLFCGNEDHEYLVNSMGQRSGFRVTQVFRRLSHISDVGQPITDPRAQGVDYSEYVMFTAPEQYKYTQLLTLFYDDPQRPEDDFLYLPQLRRVLRQSANQRCAPITNGDFTPDDLIGFNGGITRFQATYLRSQAILSLVNSQPKLYGNLSNYYPMFFPRPQIGKWEVRNGYVVDVRRIPAKRAGYCYGKQIMYIDQYSYNVMWKELYNPAMKLFKIQMSEKIASPVPKEGMQFYTGNDIETMWDIEKHHLTGFVTAGPDGGSLVANSACRNVDGVNYDDIQRYSTVGGLSQVMR